MVTRITNANAIAGLQSLIARVANQPFRVYDADQPVTADTAHPGTVLLTFTGIAHTTPVIEAGRAKSTLTALTRQATATASGTARSFRCGGVDGDVSDEAQINPGPVLVVGQTVYLIKWDLFFPKE